MILGYIKKEFYEELFAIEEEQQLYLHKAMGTEDKKEEDQAWAAAALLEKKKSACIKKHAGDIEIGDWKNFLFVRLFNAAAAHGQDKLLKVLEIYGIGVK